MSFVLKMKNIFNRLNNLMLLKNARYLPLKCLATHWIISYIDAATDKTITRLNTVFFFRKCKSYHAATTDLFALWPLLLLLLLVGCMLHVRDAVFTLYTVAVCCFISFRFSFLVWIVRGARARMRNAYARSYIGFEAVKIVSIVLKPSSYKPTPFDRFVRKALVADFVWRSRNDSI